MQDRDLFAAVFEDQSEELAQKLTVTPYKPKHTPSNLDSFIASPISHDLDLKGSIRGRDALKKMKISEMFHAAETGDLECLQEHIAEPTLLYTPHPDSGVTLVHHAAMFNQVEAVSLLLEDAFFLHFGYVVNKGYEVTKEIDQSIKNSQGSYCRTPLIIAAINGHERVIEVLIDKDKTNLDAKDVTGHTALHYAAIRGHAHCIPTLCQAGASIFVGNQLFHQDETGKNALQLAIAETQLNCMTALIEHLPEENRSIHLTRALYQIASHAGFKTLINPKSPIKVSDILIDDIVKDDFVIPLKALLMLKTILGFAEVDPTITFEFAHDSPYFSFRETTPYSSDNNLLHYAAFRGNVTALSVFLMLGQVNQQYFIDPNKGNSVGNTPLHIAAIIGRHQLIPVLTRFNAKTDVINHCNQIPIHLAAIAGDANSITLLRCEQHLHLTDNQGETPFSCAAIAGQHSVLAQLFLPEFANAMNQVSGQTVFTATLKQIDNKKPVEGQISQLIQLLQRYDATVTFLLDHNAQALLEDNQGLSPLKIVLDSSYDSQDSSKNIFIFSGRFRREPYQCQIYDLVTQAAKKEKELAEAAAKLDADKKQTNSSEEQSTDASIIDHSVFHIDFKLPAGYSDDEEEDVTQDSIEQDSEESVASIEPEHQEPDSAEEEDLIADPNLHSEESKPSSPLLEHSMFAQPVKKTNAELIALTKLLEEAEDLDHLGEDKDLMSLFTESGRSVLNLIAEESDFSEYEHLIVKHRDHPKFAQLLMLTDQDSEAPFHSICLNANLNMFRCIVDSSNETVCEVLRNTGEITIRSLGCNVMNCIALSHGNNHAYQLKELFAGNETLDYYPRNYPVNGEINTNTYQLLKEVIELYTIPHAARLGAATDKHGCNTLMNACFTGDPQLITACARLFTPSVTIKESIRAERYSSHNINVDNSALEAKDWSGEVMTAEMHTTKVNPIQVLSAVGNSDCLRVFAQLNQSALRLACQLPNAYFGTNSALEMACLTRCDSDEEKLTFIQIIKLIVNALEDKIDAATVNWSDSATKLLDRIAESDDFEFFNIGKCVSALYANFEELQQEKKLTTTVKL